MGQDAYVSVIDSHRDFSAPIPARLPVWVACRCDISQDRVPTIRRPAELRELVEARGDQAGGDAVLRSECESALRDIERSVEQGTVSASGAWSKWNELAE
eukprot:13358349-Alexandrium_andersonii.AAC.1